MLVELWVWRNRGKIYEFVIKGERLEGKPSIHPDAQTQIKDDRRTSQNLTNIRKY